MESLSLPPSLRRWWWVIASVVLVAACAAALHVVTTTSPYQARVMLQLSAPRDVDASVLDTGNPSTSTLRDDLTLLQNDFTTVLDAAEVRARTVQQLGLGGRDANYTVSASPVADSNFMVVLVSAPTEKLAQTIANAQVAQAIQFLGALRAKPANDTVQLLAAQLQAARDKLPATPQNGDKPPTADAQAAQATYASLLDKYTQASLVAANAARASYIQVASPAAAAPRPTLAHRLITLDGLAVVGGLGLGVLLVLLLERFVPPAPFDRKRSATPKPDMDTRAPQAQGFVGVSRYLVTSGTNGFRPAAVANPDGDALDRE